MTPIGSSVGTPGVATIVALVSLLSVGVVERSWAGPAPDATHGAAVVLDVWVSGGELTVDVRDAPLSEVLRTVGERAAIEVTLRGDLAAPITESFSGVPLEEGITRLARGHSVAVAYAAAPDGSRRGTLAAVWVIGLSPGPSAEQDRTADERGREATARVAAGGWIDRIRTLTEDADRGDDAAVAILAGISAAEGDAAVRRQAVAALGRLKGPEVEQALAAALVDDDASVRARAVRGLRAAGTDTAVQSLIGVLIGDTDAQVRLAALRALASFPGPRALEGFVKASSDPDDLVREAAVRGLSWLTGRDRSGPQ